MSYSVWYPDSLILTTHLSGFGLLNAEYGKLNAAWKGSEMLSYLTVALLCTGIGMYGALIILGLCRASASAERQKMQSFDMNPTTHITSNCTLCERNVLATQGYPLKASDRA